MPLEDILSIAALDELATAATPAYGRAGRIDGILLGVKPDTVDPLFAAIPA